MKLQELAHQKPTEQTARVLESYFGKTIKFDAVTPGQARAMLGRVRGLIKEHRARPEFHVSERNSAYLRLVMMEQALAHRLKETMPPVANPQAAQQATQQAISKVQDPKLKAALDKSAKGQTLNPDEQKMVAGAALQTQESRLRRAYRTLKESEVQQAQVVLAAQDLVDKMQKMLEDTSELQFKDLPALVDQIKNQIGVEQSVQFNTDATAALSGLVQNLQAARQQLDSALGVVTGQAPAAPAMPDVTGADPAAALPGADAAADPAADIDLDVDAEIEPDAQEPAAALGRPRR
jgi:hypothetical protein